MKATQKAKEKKTDKRPIYFRQAAEFVRASTNLAPATINLTDSAESPSVLERHSLFPNKPGRYLSQTLLCVRLVIIWADNVCPV